VLNACRIAAFLREGVVLSKGEGGQWGLIHAPTDARGAIQRALEIYRGQASNLETEELTSFIEWAVSTIKVSGIY
jgi:streptomycin 3"-adenylyltransferase